MVANAMDVYLNQGGCWLIPAYGGVIVVDGLCQFTPPK